MHLGERPHKGRFLLGLCCSAICWAAAQSHGAALVPSSLDAACAEAARRALPSALDPASPQIPSPSKASPAGPEGAARIAIVIDDLGYSLARGKTAARLPGAVTLAVLPHSPHGGALAEFAHQQGKEVMLHTPMSTVAGRPLDEGGLTEAMDRTTFLAVLRDNLAVVPHARGLNNHMGSLLTQDRRAMQWLMAELRSRELYFVDSRTSADSVAAEVAREQQLPNATRDVFLDNERDCAQIGRQFAVLVDQARRTSEGIAIGHPYPETLQFLAAALPRLSSSGIELVFISAMIPPMQRRPGPPLDVRDYFGGLEPRGLAGAHREASGSSRPSGRLDPTDGHENRK